MSFVINNNSISDKLVHNLERFQKEQRDSLQKLSSGQVFTSEGSNPSDRAISDSMENKLRALAASKRTINDAVSLVQTAEAGLNEINNIISRMKEINIAAATTTLSDKDRKFLFIEYKALHDEINRVASTTEFNGIPLLVGDKENTPQDLVFALGDPQRNADSRDAENINELKFEGLRDIEATTEGLGIKSADNLLGSIYSDEGITLEDAQDLLTPDDDQYATIYDQALTLLSTHRSVFGGIQERLNRAMDYNAIFAENIAAAKSKIADTDYVAEVSKLTRSNILSQATTGLIAQNNVSSGLVLSLISSILK